MADTSSAPKGVHTIVLDAGPILKNTPPLSTLLAQCEELLITPSVVSEIRDPDARMRVETMYLPFLKQRSPTPKSVSVLSEFARKTGDRAVLSKTDIEVLALAYEVECERNGGDWRLRSVPGQKQVNGKPPVKEEGKKADGEEKEEFAQAEENTETTEVDAIAEDLKTATLEDKEEKPQEEAPAVEEGSLADPSTSEEAKDEEDEAADSDGGEWITPSNLKKKQARDENISASAKPEPKVMQVATMTTDFAVCYN
jgi:RNA-binding protein NOB1